MPKLDIDFIKDRNKNGLAIVKNFPGLDAEMSEKDLRAMAVQLNRAADQLAMEEITVVHCSTAYKFKGILLGKDRKEKMYKTVEGKYVIFEKDREGDATYHREDDKALIESNEPKWIQWAGLEFPDELVKRI